MLFQIQRAEDRLKNYYRNAKYRLITDRQHTKISNNKASHSNKYFRNKFQSGKLREFIN